MLVSVIWELVDVNVGSRLVEVAFTSCKDPSRSDTCVAEETDTEVAKSVVVVSIMWELDDVIRDLELVEVSVTSCKDPSGSDTCVAEETDAEVAKTVVVSVIWEFVDVIVDLELVEVSVTSCKDPGFCFNQHSFSGDDSALPILIYQPTQFWRDLQSCRQPFHVVGDCNVKSYMCKFDALLGRSTCSAQSPSLCG